MIKIDPYYLELYRFKVRTFLRQCSKRVRYSTANVWYFHFLRLRFDLIVDHWAQYELYCIVVFCVFFFCGIHLLYFGN